MTRPKVNKDYKTVYEMFTAMKAERNRYSALWDDISKFVGIGVEPDAMLNTQTNKSATLDDFIDDPTAALSVNQQADYMVGIMWGTGDKVLDIIPSRYVKELADDGILNPYYAWVTEQVLYHMNHSDAGFHTALKPYAYDQAAFGTSGIGVFPNNGFRDGVEDNALLFRSYGVDNTVHDEGKSSLVDFAATIYDWKVSRFISEFATTNGKLDKAKLAKLPKVIREAHRNNKLNEKFKVVFMMLPRDNFDPKLKGARGARYRGVWFMEDGSGNDFFSEESFREKPISICRQVKVRNEIYGRSSGTMLLSTIRAVNFMVGTVIEILEKMSNPAMGLFNSAILGDLVLDTSPDGLTIFNQMATGKGNPAFPLYDVGDPSGIIKFILPYLNEKVTTGFKVDILLDFSSAKEMTATESMQRYVVRGKSLSGMLQQQKIEMLEPVSKRSVTILDDLGELGINPNTEKSRVELAKKNGQSARVIPQAVLDIKKAGKPWFEIKFNNELEKLTRTEAVQNLLQILQTIGAIAQVYPPIVEAVDWYKLLKDINDNLDYNNQILIDAKAFKDKVAAAAKERQQILALQAGQAAATMGKDAASANKSNQEAKNASQTGRPA